MALNDFFQVNMPYGMARYKNNSWYVFNREYLPLGFSTYQVDRSELNDDFFSKYPILTKYKSLNEDHLVKLAGSEQSVERNDQGKIIRVWFYNDSTNPNAFPEHWPEYNKKLKKLSSVIVKH